MEADPAIKTNILKALNNYKPCHYLQLMAQICPSSKTLSLKELKILRQSTQKSHIYLHCSLLYYEDWSKFGTKEETANLFLQKAGNQLPDYVLPKL